MKAFITVLIALLLSLAAAAQTRAPQGPQVFLQSQPPAVTGRSYYTTVGGVQAAINLALPGDEIVVTPGKLIGRLDFKNTPTTDGWITLRSANSALLPEKVSPADAANLVTVESPDTGQALDFWPSYPPAGVTKAHHWYVVGFNIRPSPNYPINYGLVKMGAPNWQTSAAQCPSDIWIARSVIAGYTDRELIRGVSLNGARQSITDCWIGDCHSISSDAQAICGWAGPGPFRIVGNHLEASGENFLLGGADPRINGLVPSDVEFRDNECVKPLAWNWRGPSYAGYRWGIKNLFELKNARRVLVAGNTFENCWLDQEHGQVGFAIQLTPRNQDGRAPWSTVEDVIFIGNRVRHAAHGINFLGTDDLHASGTLARVGILGNNFEDIGGDLWGGEGRLFQVLDGAADLRIAHNTGWATHSFLLFALRPAVRFSFTDNIIGRGDAGLLGDDSSEGSIAFNRYAPGGQFLGNLIVTAADVAARYPAGNYFAAPAR